MEKLNDEKKNVALNLPVRISYKVLENYLRNELVGEVIRDDHKEGETKDYAEIQALSLKKSDRENFDLLLKLRAKALTSFFKGKIVRLSFYASLEFNADKQEIWVKDYSLEGDNRSWLMNKFMQVLVNSFMYSKLKKKMKFNFRSVIGTQLEGINEKLRTYLEIHKGIDLSGRVNNFSITEIIPGEEFLIVSVSVTGNMLVNIKEIHF